MPLMLNINWGQQQHWH